MAEQHPVKVMVVGSIPTSTAKSAHSSVDRATGYEPVGRGFDSLWALHLCVLWKQQTISLILMRFPSVEPVVSL